MKKLLIATVITTGFILLFGCQSKIGPSTDLSVVKIPYDSSLASIKAFMQSLDSPNVAHHYRFVGGIVVAKDSLLKIINSASGSTIRILTAVFDAPNNCGDTTVVVTQSGNDQPQFLMINGTCICMSPCCPETKSPHSLCVLKSNN